jgi:hypothetical protein
MTVVNVTEMWSRRGGSIANVKADATDLQYSFTRAFFVVHQVDTEETTILNSPLLPQAGQQHPNNTASFVISRDASTRVGPISTIVTVAYDGESADPDSTDVEWTDTTSSEPIDRDFNGRAIVTVNGEQVEGLTVDLSDQIAIITRKFLSIDPVAIGFYRHAVNSDTFLGWPPGTARLVGFSARNRYKYGQPQEQWTVTARVQFRRGLMGASDEQAWYKRWRHEGLLARYDVTEENPNGVIRKATDNFGQEVSRPVLLRTDGQIEFNPDNAVFIYTRIYDALPYSVLGLF